MSFSLISECWITLFIGVLQQVRLIVKDFIKMKITTNLRFVRSSVGKICKIYYSNKYKVNSCWRTTLECCEEALVSEHFKLLPSQVVPRLLEMEPKLLMLSSLSMKSLSYRTERDLKRPRVGWKKPDPGIGDWQAASLGSISRPDWSWKTPRVFSHPWS